MSLTITNEHGKTIYNDEVIKKIVSYAAKETYGLVGMTSIKNDNKIKAVELLSFFDSTKGVDIQLDYNYDIIIDVYVIVQYGIKISVVAKNLIEKIKYDVENETGLKVKKITVNVQGVKVTK